MAPIIVCRPAVIAWECFAFDIGRLSSSLGEAHGGEEVYVFGFQLNRLEEKGALSQFAQKRRTNK